MTESGLQSAPHAVDRRPPVGGWSYAMARRTGTDHGRCEDAVVCETLGDTIIAAVSDGAGSAEAAHRGASIACDTFIELAIQIYSGQLDPLCLISAVQERIPFDQREAHSATLVGVVASPNGAIFLQVGDGAAVYRSESQASCEIAIWPEETEFLNHTFFLTSPDAEHHLLVRRLDAPIHEFAMVTDGLQHLVIDLKTQAPHQPFFESVFKSLSTENGRDGKASDWLASTLASEPVTKRTDDDTSIVIARRIP